MREVATTRQGLEWIWRFDILPLLEEHYYGRMERPEIIKRFGLASLKAQIHQAGSAETAPDTSPNDEAATETDPLS